MRNWKRRALTLAAAILFVGSGFALGMNVEQRHQKTKEAEEVQVNTIAVVNMDEGVAYQGEHVNFASQLMEFPGDHFVSTGLNEAKLGMQGGNYAAYVVIPEDFSEAVISVESNPQKVLVQYSVHSNLEQETQIQVIQDIEAFKTMLNTNIAYMYMDAILAEVHKVQDDSAAIMANDALELKLLEEVRAEALIADFVQPEEEKVENNLETVDVSPYLAENTSLLDQMTQQYGESVETSKAEMTQIKTGHEELAEVSNGFFMSYNSAISEMETANRQLLETAEKNLQDAITLYNKDVSANQLAMMTGMSDLVELQRISDQFSANQQKDNICNSIFEENQNAFLTFQGEWQKAYQAWKEYTSRTLEEAGMALLQLFQESVDEQSGEQVTAAYEKGAEDALRYMMAELSVSDGDAWDGTVSGGDAGDGTVSGGDAEDGTVSGGDAGNYTSDNIREAYRSVKDNVETLAADYADTAERIVLPQENLKYLKINLDQAVDENGDPIQQPVIPEQADHQKAIVLQRPEATEEEALQKTAGDFSELFLLQEEKQVVGELIRKDFVETPTEQNLLQMQKLSEKQNGLLDTMTDYENKLEGYDPLKNLEKADLNRYLNGIGTNSNRMLAEVERNNADYARYASDVYRSCNTNMSNFRGALSEANEQTEVNVKDCISGLQASRKENNAQNTEMLDNFSRIVPYTRVGSRENVEIYNYIINPVEGIGVQQIGSASVKKQEPKHVSVMTVLTVLSLAGIIVCAAVLFQKLWKQRKNM